MLDPEKLFKRTETREEVFTKRYRQLLAWALRLTNQHRASAEDLVQDAFIQFTRARTSLDEIENVDGYLHRMLRNMNLSRLSRFAEQVQEKTISIAEQELLQLDSKSLALQEHLQTREQLERICQYACTRKETSRAGSVLILRFFFEYTPTEIARVLCCSRHCVDQWQRFARREVKLYLEDPSRLKFVNVQDAVSLPRLQLLNAQGSLPEQLRCLIYSARTGNCIKTDELEEIYRLQSEEALSSGKLSHIVSCPECFDEVNRILGLPMLAQRYQPESTSSQRRPPGMCGGGGSSDGPTDFGTTFRRRLDKVIQHEPKELHITVNGTAIGSITISGDSSELILNLSPDDHINFIEIISEEDVRLLFFSLAEEQNDGHEQWAEIELSYNRILSAHLSANNGTPILRISYVVPLLSDIATERTVGESVTVVEGQRSDRSGFIPARLAEKIANLKVKRWWLKPTLATLCLALLILAAAIFFRTPLTAEDLLHACVQEETRALANNGITYQLVQLEERNNGGEVIARRRIETWQETSRNRRTRLVYNDAGLLIAGSFENGDGSRTLYHHGSTPLREEPALVAPLPFAEDAWAIDLSAKQFESLIGPAGRTHVAESNSTYTIHWDTNNSQTSIGNSSLLSATITLTKSDHHAIAQFLKIQQTGNIREYRFMEEQFQNFKESDVSPEVFSPEALSESTKPNEKRQAVHDEGRLNSSTPSMPAKIASTELEIEIAYLLDKAKGDRNEQVTLKRTAEGSLQISGVVDSETRKVEILAALASVKTNPLVKIHLNTAAERTSSTSRRANVKVVEQSFENTPDEIAVDQDLRKYLSRSDNVPDIDAATRDFSSRVLNHAYHALFQAIELKRLTSSFANSDLQAAAPESRLKWLQMIRGHAIALENETRMLRQQIKPLFFATEIEVPPDNADRILNDRELDRAIEKLHRLALVNNETIRAAFTISSHSSSERVKSREFWVTLIEAEQLTERIRGYAE